MSRENYFILLGLDPDREANDATAIQARIKTKQNEWSLGRNHVTKGKHCQMYLAEIPKIKALMAKDAERQQEAEEAKKLLAQRQADVLKDFDEQAAVAASKGYLTDADVTNLAARFKGKLSDAEARARAQQLGLSIQKGPAKQKVSRPRLDSSEESRIAGNLSIVGKADLYEFLGMPCNASAGSLHKKANVLRAEAHKIATKDAAVSAQQELAGDCMKVFGSEQDREKYDNSLAWAELNRICKLAEAAGAGEGCIRAAAVDRLLEEGKKQGVAEDEVIDAVQEVARQRGWRLEVPPKPAVKALRCCGACRKLAPETAHNCPKCGTPFKTACPNCGTVNSSETRFCSKQGCGFAVGDMPLGDRAARDARLAFSRGESAEASRLLAEALAYWPKHPEATKLSAEVKRRADDELKESKRRADEELKAVRAVEQAVTKRELPAAQTALGDLRRLAPQHPRLAALEAQVTAGLAEVAKHVAQGRQKLKEGNADDAYDAFQAALRVCPNFPEAKSGLEQCKPEPPAKVDLAVSPRAVALTWPASRSRGQPRYRVVRKAGSEPTSPKDGELVGETPGTSLTDPGAAAGVTYYYAVYAERAGVLSAKAACSKPEVRRAEVTGLKATPGDGGVSLEWQMPSGSPRGVEVWRGAGAAPRRGEGTRLQSASLRGAHDAGLKNGTSYGYRVVVIYGGADGRPLPSEGETCLATPVEPPKPVTDLRVARRGPHFEATWTVPKAGQVRLYALTAPPVQRCGEQMSAADADALGRRVNTNGPGAAREAVPGRAELHLLPVTVVGALAVVGRPVVVSWIDDVEDLAAEVREGTLRATWRWPAAIEMAVVVWRTDAYPSGPDDPSATRVEWPRQRYQIEGGFRNPAPEAEKLFLTVYAAVSRADHWEFGGGPARAEVAVNCQRRLRYKIDKGGWRSRRPGQMRLTLTPDAPTRLPDLMLVAKAGGMPLSPADGTALLALVAGMTCEPARPLERWFTPPPDFAACRVRLFPVNDADCSWLTLVAD